MNLQRAELYKVCRSLGWRGDVRLLWQAMDADSAGADRRKEDGWASEVTRSRFGFKCTAVPTWGPPKYHKYGSHLMKQCQPTAEHLSSKTSLCTCVPPARSCSGDLRCLTTSVARPECLTIPTPSTLRPGTCSLQELDLRTARQLARFRGWAEVGPRSLFFFLSKRKPQGFREGRLKVLICGL